MNKGKKPIMIYFSPAELKAIQMGLAITLENLDSTKELPWNPESRKDMADIAAGTRSAAAKIEKLTGLSSVLPPYIDGEEKDYFTKES